MMKNVQNAQHSKGAEQVDDAPFGAGLPIVNYPPGSKALLVAGSGIIYTLNDRPNVLVKVPKPFDHYHHQHEIERRAYRILGKHPNLVNVLDMDQYGIYMDRAENGCLRAYFSEGGEATVRERISWCQDLAGVVDYVHRKGIRHAELSGRNVLLTEERKILLCDFAGSSVDGKEAVIVAESGYRHPDEEEYKKPTVQAEIHALGSTMYEIMTSKQPHQGLEDYEVDRLLEKGDYPDV